MEAAQNLAASAAPKKESQLKQFDKLSAEIALKVAPTLKIKVTDDDSKNSAVVAGKEAKSYINFIETKRKELIAPLLAEQRLINDYAENLKSMPQQAEKHVKTELLNYESELAKQREEARLKLEQEANERAAKLKAEQEEQNQVLADNAALAAELGLKVDKGDEIRQQIINETETERQTAELKADIKAQSKAIEANKVSGVRQIWKFKTSDLSKVPREFLVLDESKVREHMNAQVKAGQTPALDGIEFYQEATMALR